MRTIKTTSGTQIDLDGDALAVIEAISRDLRGGRSSSTTSPTSIVKSSTSSRK